MSEQLPDFTTAMAWKPRANWFTPSEQFAVMGSEWATMWAPWEPMRTAEEFAERIDPERLAEVIELAILGRQTSAPRTAKAATAAVLAALPDLMSDARACLPKPISGRVASMSNENALRALTVRPTNDERHPLGVDYDSIPLEKDIYAEFARKKGISRMEAKQRLFPTLMFATSKGGYAWEDTQSFIDSIPEED